MGGQGDREKGEDWDGGVEDERTDGPYKVRMETKETFYICSSITLTSFAPDINMNWLRVCCW